MRSPRLRWAVVGASWVEIMTRSFVRAVARGLIGLVLMTQMMISAYACPAMSQPSARPMQMPMPMPMPMQLQVMQMPAASASTNELSSANADMPMAQASHCDDMAGMMDSSSPNLCAEHCKYGQQSDHAATLNVPAVVLTALYLSPLVPVMAPLSRPAAATLSALVAATPPHAILHCVHRT